jgi:antitoxin component YwqK of YwqJK toxin-antitoxin module
MLTITSGPRRRAIAMFLLVGACKGNAETSQVSMLESLAGREKRETKYDNGQRKDEFTVAKDSGGNYVKDGPSVSFHQNGQKSEEGTYQSGQPHGHFQKWDEDGRLTLDIGFEHGKREGKFTGYVDGVVTQTGSYTHDALQGPFRYLAFNGFVVAGEMAADVPTGNWTITDNAGKLRARAALKDGKLVGAVQSLTESGATRPPLAASGCADFGGYTLGTVRWADVIFDTLARTHAFPTDAGINKYSGGRMLSLSAGLLHATGIDKITLIFDTDDQLTALLASAEKQRGSSAYANVVKELDKEYSRKYAMVSSSMPFVGDCRAEYHNAGCTIILNAPHLDFNLEVSLRSAGFTKQLAAEP